MPSSKAGSTRPSSSWRTMMSMLQRDTGEVTLVRAKLTIGSMRTDSRPSASTSVLNVPVDTTLGADTKVHSDSYHSSTRAGAPVGAHETCTVSPSVTGWCVTGVMMLNAGGKAARESGALRPSWRLNDTT